MNESVEHFFSDGQMSDIDNHFKNRKTFFQGKNGRLHAKDSTLSFTSIEGTTEIYSNPNIVRYLEAYAFKEKIVIFVKCTGVDVNVGGIIYETVEVKVNIANNFSVELDTNTFDFTNQISNNSFVTTYNENISSPAPPSEVDIDDGYSPESESDDEIDFSTYYDENVNVPNFGSCPINEQSIPPNNADFADCIMVLEESVDDTFVGTVIWSGYQNWPTYGKIRALGVDENNNYQRVKYTDNVNPFRSINIKDPSLFKRSAKELENFQSTVLLQPRIDEIKTDGQLKSMAVQYFYRLITENGQVTEFSPTSEIVYIVPDGNGHFKGGNISESTNKSVSIICNVYDPLNFNEIECVAIEYEAVGVPTAIKSLGIKEVSAVVPFQHYGNENEFSENLTFADIVEIKTNWKYCSDINEKNNKLFAAGLRNDPLTSKFNQLKNNFALHGWAANGTTHSSLINPDPVTYRKIPPSYTGKMFFVNKKIIRSIKIFGSAQVTFTNIDTDDSISTDIVNVKEIYLDKTKVISDWLLDEQANNVDFATYFPNLEISFTDNVILLAPIDDNIDTDFSNYVFSYDNIQVIEDSEDEVKFDTSVRNETKIDGAVSAGFNSGNGIRITYRMVDDEILTKATGVFNGNGKILDMADPTLKKSFFKGEIYRLSIQTYREGQRIFAIPLGDIMIPNLGDPYHYLDDAGNIMISSSKYVNQKTVGNKLYATRVELKVEVRFDCEFSKEIDMYQLLYVERTESNRTILCQGISAPLMRLQDPTDALGSNDIDEKIRNKWMLPYTGGPVYEKVGLDLYDAQGEDYEEASYDHSKRIMFHRGMMYFDSPDIVYGQVSDSFINTSKIEVVGKLNTDHTPSCVMSSGESALPIGFGRESYPKFSRKIFIPQLKTISEISDWPKLTLDEDRDDITWTTKFVNVSVFSKFAHHNQEFNIEGSFNMGRGQVIPGTPLNSTFELSNNTFSLQSMPWWFSQEVRNIKKEDDQYKYEALPRSAAMSFGEKTVFLKTTADLFTQSFIGATVFSAIDSQIRAGNNSYVVYDTYALVNIKRGNASSIYGGRSEQAFSKNVYIPLSETKPVNKTSNASQVFNVQGDTYVTLWPRTKNSHGDEEEKELDRQLNNGRTGNSDVGDIETSYKINGAWCYAAVIETMIEPKFNHEYEFYRENDAIDFSYAKDEILNTAYLQSNNQKRYLPKPFRFRDNPLADNIVAASEVKLNGEYYDSWASFLPNEFQELDKNKGAVLNLVKEKDDLFAIQEQQTNLLYIDRDTMVQTDGEPINVKQGSGKSIDGFKVISKYGTSIRKSVVQTNEFGFMFIDERLKVLVKNDKPLTIEKGVHYDFYEKYKSDPIVDVHGSFDEKYKESNLLITTASGTKEVFSYNEVLTKINGIYEYDGPFLFSYKDRYFMPKESVINIGGEDRPLTDSLQELNNGPYLNLFGNESKMSISFYTPYRINEAAIYKHISMVLDNVSDIEKIEITAKNGLKRTIRRDHKKYNIREGVHSVPLLNYWSVGIDPSETKDIRGEWAYFKITLPYNSGDIQKITAATVYLRKSFT